MKSFKLGLKYILMIFGVIFLLVGGMTLLTEKNLPQQSKNRLITMVIAGVFALGGSFLLQSTE